MANESEIANQEEPAANAAADSFTFDGVEIFPGKETENSRADASREEVAETYRERHVHTPLRHLALPPLQEIKGLTLDDFDRLRAAVRADDTLTKIRRSRHSASNSELIIRACHLLFALVEAGGLLAGAPERDILDLKINVRDARFGLLQLARRASSSPITFPENADEESENIGEHKLKAAPGANGVRQALYAFGRLHLTAFIDFRIAKQKAQDGEPLVPKLEIAPDELEKIIGELPWLEDISDKPNLTWQKIFRHWLQSQLKAHGDWRKKVNWSNIAEISGWRLIERERYPFLIAARSRGFQTVPLPDEKIIAVLEIMPPRFTKTGHSPALFAQDSGEMKELAGETLPAESDGTEDFEKEISGAPSGGKDAMTGFGFVSNLLAQLVRSQLKEKILIEHFKFQAGKKEVKESNDLQNLLLWTAGNIKDFKVSTAHTYAARVLRALYSMPQTSFAAWKTEDVAEYLENYSTNASVKNVRTALEQFDKYLVEQGNAEAGHVNWRSRTLQAPSGFAARDVISNREYERVRETILRENEINNEINSDENKNLADLALLTLLRRCGLRVGEAAHLTPANFIGLSEWCLDVTKSKTRAGLRKLPLHLLLDETELAELRAFVDIRKGKSGADGNLFVDEKGEPVTAHRLGRRAEKLLRAGGITGETAHGLRHAFASSLFASFWLNLTKRRRPKSGESNAALRMLKEFARPEIEGRAVIEIVYMQQLLGHADLRVTFERYIHLVELAGADAVWLAEREEGFENL